MFQVHCKDPISKVGLDALGDRYVLTKDVSKAHAILVRSTSMHEAVFSENLLAIARAGAGVNNLPLQRCTEQGIIVFYTPGANANSVKELFLTGLLLSGRDILGGIKWVEAHKDMSDIAQRAEKEKKVFSGIEIKKKRLGVIGLGAVGTQAANAAQVLGMEVLGYDPFLTVEHAWKLHHAIQHVIDINIIFETCDFITLHVPVCESTKGLIGKEAISKMKPAAVILNFARNSICEETAVIDALEQGKLRKYVTDFPTPKTAGHKDCIVLPHLGASTEEAEAACALMAAEALKEYLEHGNIRYSVNFPSCDMGYCQTTGRITVLHKTDPTSDPVSCIQASKIPIYKFLSSSKNGVSCTIIDIEQSADESILKQLRQLKSVLRVRSISQQA